MNRLTKEYKIKVVILDFDDTIYRGDVWKPYGEYIKKFLTELLKSPEKASEFMTKYDIDYSSNGYKIAKALIEEFKTAKVMLKYEKKNRYYLDLSKVRTVDPQILENVSKRYPLYIVSNSDKGYVKYYLKQFNINKKLFKKIYQNKFNVQDSTKTQYYMDIVEREKVLIEEVLVIGDSYENDIVPAINLGMKAMHIKSIDEVENILSRLS